MTRRTFGLALVFSSVALLARGDVIRRLSDLYETTFAKPANGIEFDVEATVAARQPSDDDFLPIADESGAALVATDSLGHRDFLPGDSLRLTGTTLFTCPFFAVAHCRKIEFLGHEPPPVPREVSAREFLSGAADCRPVRLRGLVRDALLDEVDARYVFLVLNCGGEYLYAHSRQDGCPKETLDALVGASVIVEGVCIPQPSGLRYNAGRMLSFSGLDAVTVLDSDTRDPFDAPDVSALRLIRPDGIAALGRHSLSGRVLARWNGNRILVLTGHRRFSTVELSKPTLPPCDEVIDAVGFPESDLYHINLTRARWRKSTRPAASSEPLMKVSASDLLSEENGKRILQARHHGQLVGLSGRVIRSDPKDATLLLDDNGTFFTIRFDPAAGPFPQFEENARVAVTGICIMESENWRPNLVFPRLTGFFIVARRPQDLTLLAHAPLWTPRLLALVIGSLLFVLLAIFGWNVSLRHLVKRRSRALLKEQAAHLCETLRVDERTRLAVELHDSVAQNLTGVSLQLDAARRFADDDRDRMMKSLDEASQTLHASREELRNCLWDLRTEALDEPDLNEAIRRTVRPQLGSARLTVRFNVPRGRLTDNTAHTILRIVRELVSNAVQHGHAENIAIAGSLDGARLRFSVRDNGCGFDPERLPGPGDGHFGLQGIRERVRRHQGKLRIDSKPGSGSKITITLGTQPVEKRRA